jgi:hypothetical protein
MASSMPRASSAFQQRSALSNEALNMNHQQAKCHPRRNFKQEV